MIKLNGDQIHSLAYMGIILRSTNIQQVMEVIVNTDGRMLHQEMEKARSLFTGQARIRAGSFSFLIRHSTGGWRRPLVYLVQRCGTHLGDRVRGLNGRGGSPSGTGRIR